MTAVPRVSVLVPCYNLGQYLDEAVESVLAQTFPDFEIIVVDDGSTDPATRALLAGYRRPRTRVLTTDNRGLAAARNLAIEHARGEYLCALDADDRLEPTYLAKTVARLDADPSLTFVGCWLQLFGEEHRVWKHERCDLPALLAECRVGTAALVRRSAVLAVGGYDGRMHEGYQDWDLWISLVERGFRGTILPEVLFHYRRRPGSMSTVSTRDENHLRLVGYLLEKHAESYRRSLLEVLRDKDREIGELLRENAELEWEIETSLAPEVARRREELAALRARSGGRMPAELAAALENAEREVAALRNSWSWRVTAPLRAVYGLLLRMAGR